MEQEVLSSLFTNDGSFMEKFKKLQNANENGKEEEKDKGTTEKDCNPKKIVLGSSTPKDSVGKMGVPSKANGNHKSPQPASSGKFAFSLKHKSKLAVQVVKLDEDDEDAAGDNHILGDESVKRQKLDRSEDADPMPKQLDVAPPSPSNHTVKNVADKLASFVAKNGREIEHVTRQRNPGNTPFKFLFDKTSADYKYYEYQINEEQRALSQTIDSKCSSGGNTSSKSKTSTQISHQEKSSFQIPASALYDMSEPSGEKNGGESCAQAQGGGADPIAMMEFYMKRAAQEERRRQPRQSKDEMPPPASLHGPAKKGHHMGDYIPEEELEKFLARCNDASSLKTARESAEKARIQADNVGHRLLSRMGWREGEGLGSTSKGIADPIMGGSVKKDHLGVGAHQPGEVTPEDDMYEQYKKRMMLGYRYRPNPLNNPRKAYY